MKVVLVWRGPDDSVEREVLARRQVPLLVRLSRQGISPAVVLLGDRGGLRADLANVGIPVEVLPTRLAPYLTAAAHLPAAVFRLQSVFRRHDPDVLEGDEPLPAIATGLAAPRRRRAVVVYRRHHHGGRRRLIVASRLAAKLADRTIVSCEAMRHRAAGDDGTRPDRIDIASSGTEDSQLPAAAEVAVMRQARGIPATAQVIGVFSRLSREKGLDVLMNALDLMGGVGEVHVVMVGTGPEESRLRQLAARSHVVVHFLGHREDVGRWLAAADVVAMPSRREAFGRVTLEAMAAGRPLVASRVDGLAEAVIDRETGLLVPPDNAHALAAALTTLLNDRQAAKRMGDTARRRYEAQYTLDHMATGWRQAWERAAAKAGVC